MTRKQSKFKVNEKFFEAESKVMMYLLGISIAQYSSEIISQKSVGNKWQSTSRTLIEKVGSLIASEHTIESHTYENIREDGDDFTTHWLRIHNKRLYDSLREKGLDVPKSERMFPPNIEEQYLDHLVRGLFDAKVLCRNSIYRKEYDSGVRFHADKRLPIYFNVPFLKDLYDILVEHAHVKGGRDIEKSPLILHNEDVRAVYDFLYRDWKFIRKNGLYLPTKKDAFEVNLTVENQVHHSTLGAEWRIGRGQIYLLEGMTPLEASNELGYKNLPSFYRAFKNMTGKTPLEFLRENITPLHI